MTEKKQGHGSQPEHRQGLLERTGQDDKRKQQVEAVEKDNQDIHLGRIAGQKVRRLIFVPVVHDTPLILTGGTQQAVKQPVHQLAVANPNIALKASDAIGEQKRRRRRVQSRQRLDFRNKKNALVAAHIGGDFLLVFEWVTGYARRPENEVIHGSNKALFGRLCRLGVLRLEGGKGADLG